MPDIDADDVPAAFNEVSENIITWNTHRKIMEKFDYPDDPELFGDWLVWYYDLPSHQKHILRQDPLNTINVSDYPTPPHSRSS